MEPTEKLHDDSATGWRLRATLVYEGHEESAAEIVARFVRPISRLDLFRMADPFFKTIGELAAGQPSRYLIRVQATPLADDEEANLIPQVPEDVQRQNELLDELRSLNRFGSIHDDDTA